MLHHTKIRALAALTIVLACLAVGPARAACTNPAGNEADIKYNADYHTYQYCNGTTWVAYGGGIGSGAMSFISTQTASASASLQWTGLGSYNNYELICSGVYPATNGANPELQFGEGATPTWETATYKWEARNSVSTPLGSDGGSDSAAAILFDTGLGNTASGAIFIDAIILGVPSSTTYKAVNFQATDYDGTHTYTLEGGGEYIGDTNPITAVRVLMSSGNITAGTCSLYGLN